MTSILMVCLGNICRSPLAHGILESKLHPDYFYIDSAGTGNYHVGEAPDHRSITIANTHGIDISNQRARQFKVEDFDRFDHIVVMDQSNYDDVVKLARDESEIKKVQLILECDPLISNKEVPDPYHGGASDFAKVYSLLERACNYISDKLQNS